MQENAFFCLFVYCEDGQTLELVAQKRCGVSIFGDGQNLTLHSCEQPAAIDSALSRGRRLDDLKRSLPASTIR